MKYSGVSILGSKFGFFSSYALAVMLMHVFNTSFSLDKDLTHMSHGIADCHADIGVEGVRRGSGKNESDSMNSSAKPVVATTSPFAVFHKFLEIFSQFQWNSHVLTVASGAVPIQFGTGHAGSGENSSENVPHIDHFRAIISKYQLMLEDYTTLVESGSKCNSTKDGSETRMRSPSFSSSASFTLRLCNVQDPLVCSNNLCLGVTATTLQLIEHTFRAGYYHLQQVMFNASNNKRNKRSHSMDRELGATAGQSQNPISIQEESVRVRSEKIPVAEDGESLQSIRETNFYSSDEESVCGVDEGNESEADSGVTVLRKTTSTATPLATTNLSHSPPSPPGRKRESKQSNTSLPPLPCAPWANASPNSTQKMLKEKLPKAQSQTSAPVMPSSRNTYILEEFFSRSCISYFGSFYKIPERNRPTLYQYIQKKFSKEHLSRHEGYKCFDGDADEIAAIIEYLKSPHITTVDVKGDRSTAGSSESTSELTCGFCSDTNPAPKVETVGVEGVACANAAHHKVELVNASCQTIETLPSMKYHEPNPCPDGVASPVATSTMKLTSVSISNRLEDDSDKILSTPTVCKQHIANKASVVTTPQMVQMEHGGIDESSFQTPSINGQEDHAQPQAQLQFLSFINAVLNYLGSIQIVKDSGFIIVDTVVYDRQQSKAVCSATHSSTSASKTRKRNRSHSNCHNHSQGGNPNVSSVKAGSAINIQRKRTLWPVVVAVFCLIIGGVMLFGKLLGVDATSFYAMWNGKSLSYFNRKPPAKLHGNQAEAAMNSRMAKSLFDNGGASHSLNSNPVGDESIAVGDNQDIDCFGVGQCQRAAPVVPDTGVGESGTRQKNKEKEEIALETVGDTTALLGSQAPSQGFPKEIPIRTECTPLYIPVVTHYVKIGQPISLSVDETDEQLLHYLLDVSDVNVDLSAVDSMDTQFGVSGRVPNGKLGQNLGVELDSNEDVWDFDVESLRGTDAASLDTESDFAFDMGNGDAFHGKDRVFKSLPSHPKESSSGLCDYSGHNKGMGVCQSVDSIRANVGGSKAKISDYFRFQWMRDSKVLHNATETSTYSVSRTTNGHAGVYSCYAIPKHVPNPRLKFTSSDNAVSGNNFISQLDSMNSAHGGYHSRYYKPPQQKYKIATTNIVISSK